MGITLWRWNRWTSGGAIKTTKLRPQWWIWPSGLWKSASGAPAGGVPTDLARAAGYKDINKVLKYFVISESLINRTEDLEGIGECGSQPHIAVECGSTVGKQTKDRKEKFDNERLQLESEVRTDCQR